MKWRIQSILTDRLVELGYSLPRPLGLDVPSKAFGHYSTNIAFLLAKGLQTNPKELAAKLAVELCESPFLKGFCMAEAVNGFINFIFSPEFLWTQWRQFCNGSVQFPPTRGRILLEYVSANPTGPLHIGHGRWAVLGDVLARILHQTGHDVSTEFYINDAGNQVVKLEESVAAIRAGKSIPEDGYHGVYVHELAAQSEDPVQANLLHQQAILSRFGVQFDTWFSEKTLYSTDQIQSVLDQLETAGLSYLDSEATWFRSTQFGDDKDRVLVKSDGTFTYFLGDLAYHYHKVVRGFDSLINVWGADHHGYVHRVRAGVVALCGDTFKAETHFKVILGQLVHLFRDGEPVKMSKRTGDLVTLEEVIDEIGVDATRYFLVEKSPDTHVEFDLALAKSQSSDNPVYYVQYAHARLSGVLKQWGETIPLVDAALAEPWLEEELLLMWQCVQFSDVLWTTAQNLAPHQWVTYTWQLAKQIQLFYHACPIIKANETLRARRYWMTQYARYTLYSSLALLGISAPDSM